MFPKKVFKLAFNVFPIVCLLLLIFEVDNSILYAGDDLKKEFLEKAPQQWKEYLEFARRLQGTQTRLIKKGGKIDSHDRLTFKSNDRCKLIKYRSLLPKKELHLVHAYNPRYAFSLKSKKKAASWAITALKKMNGDALPAPAREVHDSMFLLNILVYAYMGDLQELVSQPTFRVLQVNSVNRDGKSLIQINFDNTHQVNQESKFFAIQSGSLILDPQRYWCLWECDLKTKHPSAEGRIKVIDTQLVDDSAKYPVPKRRVETHEIDMTGIGQLKIERRYDYELFSPSILPPDEEFAVSAFGLPEPFGMKTQQTTWFVWAAGIGILCLIAGVVLFKVKQRLAT